MNNIKSFGEVLCALHNYCQKEKYKGYSLLDSHNSPIPFRMFGNKISFIINQISKRSPINIRPLIGVKKDINPKAYGLLLHAYSLLSQMDVISPQEAEKKAQYFFDWLTRNPSQGYSGHCWGYNYYWPKRDGSGVPAYTPSVVVTGFIARSMLVYYEVFKVDTIKKILKSSAQFVLNDIHLYKGHDGYCFSYTPVKRDKTVNASLLASEILAYCDYVNAEDKYQSYIENVIKFTFNNQNEDGSWYYSFHYDTGKPKKQIDFHQGYVLESILRLSQYTKIDCEKYHDKIQKGLAFYYNNQFDKEGFAYWRLPQKWPVDIHNQSQGIITFSSFRDYHENYLRFAKQITQWTIENMQGPRGNFYYQKWPLITNKISYLRWNQAWMMLALVLLLSATGRLKS